MRKPDDSRAARHPPSSPQNVRGLRTLLNRVPRRWSARIRRARTRLGRATRRGHPNSRPGLRRVRVERLRPQAAGPAHHDVGPLPARGLRARTGPREPELRFFAAPGTAGGSPPTQVLDSLYAASGKTIDVEEITFDPDGRRPPNIDVISPAFQSGPGSLLASRTNGTGRASAQPKRSGGCRRPRSVRPIGPSACADRSARRSQRPPAGRAGEQHRLGRSITSGVVPERARRLGSRGLPLLSNLVDSIFLAVPDPPADRRRESVFVAAPAEGFARSGGFPMPGEGPQPPVALARVTSVEPPRLRGERHQDRAEKRSRQGPPVDPRLVLARREVHEDFVWSVMNTRAIRPAP